MRFFNRNNLLGSAPAAGAYTVSTSACRDFSPAPEQNFERPVLDVNDGLENDDWACGAMIASDVLENDPQNPRAVRVFDGAGNKILTFERKPASESEVLGEPIDVQLDPDRESKIQQFFYHLIKARQLAQEIHFSQYGPESETKVGIFFNRLAESRKLMRGLCERVGPRFLANLKDVRRLTRELAPIKNGR
jgi:hypothetical protein